MAKTGGANLDQNFARAGRREIQSLQLERLRLRVRSALIQLFENCGLGFHALKLISSDHRQAKARRFTIISDDQ